MHITNQSSSPTKTVGLDAAKSAAPLISAVMRKKIMSEYFKLKSTYEVFLEFSQNTRPIRIEIFYSIKNNKKLRARVWDQNTYNLYPTFANISEEEGLKNKLLSCDDINREITMILSDEPNDLVWGKEWDSEEKYLSYIKELLNEYQKLQNE